MSFSTIPNTTPNQEQPIRIHSQWEKPMQTCVPTPRKSLAKPTTSSILVNMHVHWLILQQIHRRILRYCVHSKLRYLCSEVIENLSWSCVNTFIRKELKLSLKSRGFLNAGLKKFINKSVRLVAYEECEFKPTDLNNQRLCFLDI